jgi:hypothetical protein
VCGPLLILWLTACVNTSTPTSSVFGLFNPAVYHGIAADTLVAAFNRLAAWSHSPLRRDRRHPRALEYVRPRSRVDGTFTSGGAEANHGAQRADAPRTGRCALPGQPIFTSRREPPPLPVPPGLRDRNGCAVRYRSPAAMDENVAAYSAGSEAGLLLFMVVVTAGTTSGLSPSSPYELERANGSGSTWMRRGARVLVPELRPLPAERAD